ncbi:hypothetical protein [Aeromonas veronii]|uniref:hypothetical protein n=1 Tax=Aeromonas veronii TaxID=654 RepID=UPI0035BB7F78
MDTLIKQLFEEIDFDEFKECEQSALGATSCPQCSSRQYFYGNEIDYTCEQKRKLYVLRYLPVHASEISQGIDILKLNGAIRRTLSQNNLAVLSIGGGPGSDIVGFRDVHRVLHEIRACREDEPYIADVQYTKIDINRDWNDLFHRVINTRSDDKPDHINEDYECFYEDVTSINVDIDIQDVILLSYIVSELTDDEAIVLANNIKQWSNENTIVIVNDRNQEEVTNRVNSMFKILKTQDAGEFEITGWAGFVYPDKIRDACEVTLNRSSLISYAMGCQ